MTHNDVFSDASCCHPDVDSAAVVATVGACRTELWVEDGGRMGRWDR